MMPTSHSAVAKISGGAYGNSGQDCMAATRVYVAASKFDELVERLAQAAEAVVVGDPSETATEMGPVISESQRERIKGFVDRAIGSGAKMVVGGEADGPGFWYRPTVLIGMQQGDEIIQKEVFGPVITVMPFGSPKKRLAGPRRRRTRRLGVYQQYPDGDVRGARPPVRYGLDQRPHAGDLGDAARRFQAIGSGKRHVGVRA